MTDEAQRQVDHDTITRLETKFDAFALEMRAAYASATMNVSDHEARIRVLETAQDRVLTTTKTVGIVASIVGAFLGATVSIIIILSGVLKHP